MKTLKKFFNVFLSAVMAITLSFPAGWGNLAYASQGGDTLSSAGDDPVVGSLKIVARYNDSMSFYDGHAYLVFTSYQDGVSFPCDSTTNYAAYSVDNSYYADIDGDLANGSWRTGTDADQYFTLIDQSDLPGTMTVDRGQVITIGNYRDFDMTVAEAALGAIENSTAWTTLSNEVKIAIVNAVLNLLSSQSSISGEDVIQALQSATGSSDSSFIMSLIDGKVNGGICYNRELYNQKLEWDQFENVTYEIDITQSQLDDMQAAMAKYNYFSLLENSCATVAVGLWNVAVGSDSAYKLSANGSGVFSIIQEPKFVRQSIESTLVGYNTNKLNSVEEQDAAATTDGVTYYVTGPSKVDSAYTLDTGNIVSIDTEKTSLEALRFAGTPSGAKAYSYPTGAVNYNTTIKADVSLDGLKAQYNIDSVAFNYGGTTVSELSDYEGDIWFTASANKDSVVTDANGNKLTSYYDEANKLVHFKVSSLPATCIVQTKADVESSNLTVVSDGEQDVYYYNGDEKVAVTDASTIEENETVYVKPKAMTNKVVETITLTTANSTTDLKSSYNATEGAYSFTMPAVNAQVAIDYADVTIVEKDNRAVIQLQKGSELNLSDYFSVETTSASKAEMQASLKYKDVSQTSGIVSVSEDGTVEGLGEGKASVKVYLSDDVCTLVAIDVYDGEMVSVEFGTADNGTYKVTTEYDGVSAQCYYSGYLVKKGSKVTVTMTPDEGYVVSGAYYGTGIFKSLTLNEITGSFTADQDTTIKVSFAKAEITNVSDEISMKEGGTTQLNPVLHYTDQSGDVFDGSLTYTSSDEAIVKVDENGQVTAVSNGIAVITIAAGCGNKVTRQCSVNVGDVDGDAIVGRLTISARPYTEEQWTPHGFVTFTSYQDGLSLPSANYDRYYEYLQEYLDTINNAEEGVDGRLYNDSIPQSVRETYFDAHEQAGVADIALNKGDVVTVSAYSTASNQKAVWDAFINGDIAQYPSFQEMLRVYQNLQTDQDKVALFDSTLETLEAVFTEIYVNGNRSPINGYTDGGIDINRELYNQFRRGDTMTPNNSYTIEITANEFAHLKAYMANPENNYYSLVTHSCSTVAAEIWNETLYDKESLHVNCNYSLFFDEPMSLYASIGLLMQDPDKEGMALTNFVPGPGKNKEIEDLTSYSTLNIVNVQNGTVVVTDAEGNVYQSGDRVKKGTTLTVNYSCAYGYLLDTLHVNGQALDGNTFTMKQDSNLCVSFQKSTLLLDKTALTMNVGSTDKLGATVRHTADIATNKYDDVVFESSDPSIVEVDQYGNITALKSGAVEVTATAKYGNGVFDRCYIIVQDDESSQDIVGKLMIVARYSDEALAEGNWGHSFFQFTSNQDNVSIDVTNMMWLFTLSNDYYKAVNSYDGTGADPVTYHSEACDPASYFTQVTDMTEIGNTYTLNRDQIFTIGNSTNHISSLDCALAAILKGDVADILIKHGKYAMIGTLYDMVLNGKLSFRSFTVQLIATLAEIGYDMETGFNPFNGAVEDAGVTVNRELYRQAVDINQYPNTAYEIEITRDQLAILMMYMNDHSYYSVLDNNCTAIIADAWNVVTSGQESLKVDAGINGSLASPKKLMSEITRIASGKAGYEVNHEVFKPAKTNYIVYDPTKYLVVSNGKVVEPYELIDEGAVLTVYVLDENGQIDSNKYIDSITVNGETLSGNTFISNGLRQDLSVQTRDNIVPVYRMYNTATSEHLWTTDENEYKVLTASDWAQEGIAWGAPTYSSAGVHRLYNAGLGTHHYTSNESEIKELVEKNGWTDEGVIFYAADANEKGAAAVYRLYNAGLSGHMLTMSTNERTDLVTKFGWADENIAFYVYKVD